ncbi:sensor domain-containing diguanylate cyclase [Pelagibaculum spongiae]|uniref:diguanylate cyclase n=1 Tax=Pelagibaculum spongiae TaxID=2080658 RepID=A0A2V1GWJ2_9GAMM|nr:sensor domain-containing diguanylate cyclase [Pelagibaculum spongiae]PVZ64920.1 hypothetical protein DC094_18830 [Pelagibaculum spongiae]
MTTRKKYPIINAKNVGSREQASADIACNFQSNTPVVSSSNPLAEILLGSAGQINLCRQLLEDFTHQKHQGDARNSNVDFHATCEVECEGYQLNLKCHYQNVDDIYFIWFNIEKNQLFSEHNGWFKKVSVTDLAKYSAMLLTLLKQVAGCDSILFDYVSGLVVESSDLNNDNCSLPGLSIVNLKSGADIQHDYQQLLALATQVIKDKPCLLLQKIESRYLLVSWLKDSAKQLPEIAVAAIQQQLALIVSQTLLSIDISHVAKSEKSLNVVTSPEIYKETFTKAQSALLLMDQNGRLLEVNSAAAAVFQHSINQMVGSFFQSYVKLSDWQRGLKSFYQLLAGKRERLIARKRLVGPQGELIWCDLKLSTVMSKGIILVEINDISRILAQQEQLHSRNIQLAQDNQLLQVRSETDELTGLHNRRALVMRLAQDLERTIRNQHFVSVVMLDVDHFKSYNDQFGHLAGDQVLKIIGEILRGCVRTIDMAARYGGEEFTLVLPETDIEGAMSLAERCRASIEAFIWPMRDITVSLGVVSCQPKENEVVSSAKLLSVADKALYQAKHSGRNKIVQGSWDSPAQVNQAS